MTLVTQIVTTLPHQKLTNCTDRAIKRAHKADHSLHHQWGFQMCDTWRHRWGNCVIVWYNQVMSEPDAINDAFTVQSIWIPFLMITLDLPSSEGTWLCPVQSAGRVLALVSVSVCCKKVGGRIHQRYKDRCYSGSWSSLHSETDIETEPVIYTRVNWISTSSALDLWSMRESSGSDCELEVSDHPLGDSLAKMMLLTMPIWLWRILLSSVQIFMFIWLTGLWQSYG